MPGLGKHERVRVYELIDSDATQKQVKSYIKEHAVVISFDKEKNYDLLNWLRKLQWHEAAEAFRVLLESK